MFEETTTIALAGLIACGKSTAATVLEQKMGFHVVRTRDVLADLMEAQGVPVNDFGLQEFGHRILGGSDAREFCEMVVGRLCPGKCNVVDAVRPLTHFELLQDRCGAKLLYIDATPEQRVRRYMERQGGRESTRVGFQKRMQYDVEQNVEGLVRHADAIVVNEGRSEFFSNVVSAGLTISTQ